MLDSKTRRGEGPHRLLCSEGTLTDGVEGCRRRNQCRLNVAEQTRIHVLREATHAQEVSRKKHRAIRTIALGVHTDGAEGCRRCNQCRLDVAE